MGQNGATFGWTKDRDRAALLLAEDELGDRAIAAELGISRSTLDRWKQHPDFTARIAEHIAELNAAMHRLAIAKKYRRVQTLDRLHGKLLDVIEHRAERYAAKVGDDPEVAAVEAAKRMFGGTVPFEATTGLLVEKESVNNAGHRTTEWSVDVAMLREIRALEEQAAKELGQWIDKAEVDQRVQVVELVGVDPEDI